MPVIDPDLIAATAALQSIGRDIPMPASASELIFELAEMMVALHRAMRAPPEVRALLRRMQGASQ